MGLYNKVYIGHVETVNTEVYENSSPIESKVVALRFKGFDKKNNIPKYEPLRKYSEYYKIEKVEPLTGFVNDKIINQAIKNTGKEEVRKLMKVA